MAARPPSPATLGTGHQASTPSHDPPLAAPSGDTSNLPEDASELRAHIRRSRLHSSLQAQGRTWAASVQTDLDRLATAVTAAGAAPYLTPARPELPVGGRMRHFAPLWAALLDGPFASSACYEGIVPDLHTIPPYRGPPPLRPLPADRVRPMREMV